VGNALGSVKQRRKRSRNRDRDNSLHERQFGAGPAKVDSKHAEGERKEGPTHRIKRIRRSPERLQLYYQRCTNLSGCQAAVSAGGELCGRRKGGGRRRPIDLGSRPISTVQGGRETHGWGQQTAHLKWRNREEEKIGCNSRLRTVVAGGGVNRACRCRLSEARGRGKGGKPKLALELSSTVGSNTQNGLEGEWRHKKNKGGKKELFQRDWGILEHRENIQYPTSSRESEESAESVKLG